MSPPDPAAPSAPTDAEAHTLLLAPDQPWGQAPRPSPRAPQLVHRLALASAAALIVLLLLLSMLGSTSRDLYTFTRAYAPTSGRVAVVTVGDDALYLWDSETPQPDTTPRILLANVVRFLEAAQTDVIVLDYLLEGNTDDDASLAEAARRHGRVVVAEAAQLADPATGRRFSVAPPPAIDQTTVSGLANFHSARASLLSSEQVVRSAPLITRLSRMRTTGRFPSGMVGALQDDAAVLPSLALQAAWLAANPEQDPSALQHQLQQQCSSTPLRCTLDWSQLGLPAAAAPPSNLLAVNFRGPEQGDGLPTIPASRILRAMGQAALLDSLGAPSTITVPHDLKTALEGRVVVVGRSTGRATSDRFATPFAAPTFLHPDMSGVRIHAQIIDTLLTGRHIRTIPSWLTWPASLLLMLGVARSHRLLRDDLHALGWILVSVGVLASGVSLFHLFDGLTLEAGTPLTATLGTLLWVHLRGRPAHTTSAETHR